MLEMPGSQKSVEENCGHGRGGFSKKEMCCGKWAVGKATQGAPNKDAMNLRFWTGAEGVSPAGFWFALVWSLSPIFLFRLGLVPCWRM